MDGDPPGASGSMPSNPEDCPDTRLLSNPLMGGESRGCGIRVLGRLVNTETEEGWAISVALSEMCPWGSLLDRCQQLASIHSLHGSSKRAHLHLQSPVEHPKPVVTVYSVVKTLAAMVKYITLHWRFKNYLQIGTILLPKHLLKGFGYLALRWGWVYKGCSNTEH